MQCHCEEGLSHLVMILRRYNALVTVIPGLSWGYNALITMITRLSCSYHAIVIVTIALELCYKISIIVLAEWPRNRSEIVEKVQKKSLKIFQNKEHDQRLCWKNGLNCTCASWARFGLCLTLYIRLMFNCIKTSMGQWLCALLVCTSSFKRPDKPEVAHSILPNGKCN